MNPPSPLRLHVWHSHRVAVAQPIGQLDLSSRVRLMDGLLKLAAAEPAALMVLLARLDLGSPPAVGVFYRVWQQVTEWPGIPVVLVVPDPEVRAQVEAGPIVRFVPVCASLGEAVLVCRAPPPVRQRQLHLPCGEISGLRARLFVTDACLDWGVHEELGDVLLITEELVTGVVAAGGPELWLRVRLHGHRLTVSARDRTPAAGRRPAPVAERLALAHGRMPGAGGAVTWAALTVHRPI